MSKKTNKSTFLYFFDPLCGWCYGFSNVLTQLNEKYSATHHFEVICGGMVVHDRVGPIGEVAAYIKEAYKAVEDRSGVQFGQPFLDRLDEGSTIFSSLEPSRAFVVLKALFPDRQVEIASLLHKAIYHEGLPPVEMETYLYVLKQMNEDNLQFKKLYATDKSLEETEKDFYHTQQFSIQGFPALILHHNDEYFMVAKGYSPYENVEAIVQKITNG